MEMPQDEPLLSVTELNRMAQRLLEDALPSVWVMGEVSNFLHHGSGHMYFDLKDDEGQVRCAMFRGANRGLAFAPGNGQQVLVNARVTIYAARGSFQLVVQHMEPAGEGLLRQRFEALKARLAAAGLFAEEHKQALPHLPRRVGVITSPSGAAVRDILKVLGQRFPAVPIVIYPSAVQGDKAKHELVHALETAGQRDECDIIILGRGGGSLEDLWAFNEEIVVRAIHACPLPVISAVGHETDITLADLVADERAATPSAAAERVVPDQTEWLRRILDSTTMLARAMGRLQAQRHDALKNLTARLERCHPVKVLQQHAQRLDELGSRQQLAIKQRLSRERTQLEHMHARLSQAAPLAKILLHRQSLTTSEQKLQAAIKDKISEYRQRNAVMAAALQTVSPLATLERGYAILRDAQGRSVRDAEKLKAGQAVTAKLAHGSIAGKITKILKD